MCMIVWAGTLWRTIKKPSKELNVFKKKENIMFDSANKAFSDIMVLLSHDTIIKEEVVTLVSGLSKKNLSFLIE